MFIFRGVVAALLPLAIGVLSIVGHVPRPAGARLAHRGVGVLAEPHDRDGARPGDRLQPVRRLALPRGARRGLETDDAVVRTVRTAGRTVAFSATTVAASLCALLVFPLAFLRSFAYAGVAVAALAGGLRRRRAARDARRARPPGRRAARLRHRRAEAGRRRLLAPRGDVRHAASGPDRHGRWSIVPAVPRQPVPATSTSACPDDRVLPQLGAGPPGQRRASARDFSSQEAGALTVVAPDTSAAGTGAAATAAIGALRARRCRWCPASPGSTRSPACTCTARWCPSTRSLTARFALDVGHVAVGGPDRRADLERGRGRSCTTCAPSPRRSRCSSAGQSAELVDTQGRRCSTRCRSPLGIIAVDHLRAAVPHVRQRRRAR